MNKRQMVRQILNRKKNYLLTSYVRYINNKLGRTYSKYDIVSYLNKLKKQHVINYSLKGKRVVGRVLATAFL